jgi:1-acyl-sn-glycerol-3-phosphate acyltransferase
MKPEKVRTPIWRVPLGIWRLCMAVGYLLWVSQMMRLRFAGMSPKARHDHVKSWSAGLLRRLGVRLVVQGQFRPGAKLVVGNHVSWMDIMAINAAEPSCFVSKAEVGRWPVVGPMVVLAGTILLERARRRDAMRVMGLLAQSLKEGRTAAVFPEGTTGNGHTLLTFHGNLLQSAIDADVPVQPVALRYSDARHPVSPAAAYVGDISLVTSLWWVACAQGMSVQLTVLPPQRVTHADRRALAESLRVDIERSLQETMPA